MKTSRLFTAFILIVCLLLTNISLVSCGKKEETAPTCEELITAYTAAGYNAFHDDSITVNENSLCCVKVWLDDEYDYVFFNYFDSPEHAEEYEKDREFNIILWFFTVIYGQPTWLHTNTYDVIEYEYENPELLIPFKELIE